MTANWREHFGEQFLVCIWAVHFSRVEKSHAGIDGAELVVCSITDDVLRGTSNLRMLRNARATCPTAKVMLTTEHIPHALQLYEAGADFVYIPRLHSAAEIARILKEGLAEGFEAARASEVARLSDRKEVLA